MYAYKLENRDKRAYLLMDNFPWHKKAKRFIESEEGKL